MATAAAIAAAAATAVSAGVGAASAAGAFGGAPGKPQFKPVPKRPLEQAQQKYMSRVMMSNLNTRGPTYQDWLASGGKAQFQLTNTGMTPQEAQRLGYVTKGGKEPTWYDPSQGGPLSRQQYVESAMATDPGQKTRIGNLGRVSRRIENLTNLSTSQEGGLRPGQQARLTRLQGRQQEILGRAGYGGA